MGFFIARAGRGLLLRTAPGRSYMPSSCSVLDPVRDKSVVPRIAQASVVQAKMKVIAAILRIVICPVVGSGVTEQPPVNGVSGSTARGIPRARELKTGGFVARRSAISVSGVTSVCQRLYSLGLIVRSYFGQPTSSP